MHFTSVRHHAGADRNCLKNFLYKVVSNFQVAVILFPNENREYKMIITYGLYLLLFYFSYRVLLVIKKYFVISPELRHTPSIPLIQNIGWNKAYLVKKPYVQMVRDHLMESLNVKGIIKVIVILFYFLTTRESSITVRSS